MQILGDWWTKRTLPTAGTPCHRLQMSSTSCTRGALEMRKC
ncbi:hypothetical protein [Caudoviricetes sp.]|nr:hypothetical protein [Caudoviricetes sp.]